MNFLKSMFFKTGSKEKLSTKAKSLVFTDRIELEETKRKAGSRRNAGA